MLFYVEEGAFSQREIQQVVTAIREIVGVLRKTKTQYDF